MCHSFRRTVLIAYAGVIRAIRWTAREIVVQRHKLFKVDHRRAAAVTRHLAASRDRRKRLLPTTGAPAPRPDHAFHSM
jgi:hypothetical protein